MPSSPREHAHGHAHPAASLLPRLLDLDAQVHAPLLEEAMTLVVELAGGPDQARRILDVGAGTGTGSVALAQHFGRGQVVAVDVDKAMLQRVRDRAAAYGVADRISTLGADVASADPGLGWADVIWSSLAMHEAGDPRRAFGHLFDALQPGGLLVVVEMEQPTMVLPGRLAGLEQRLRTAAGATPATHHPDWTTAMRTAGLEEVTRRTLTLDRELPADGPAGEHAVLELRRLGLSGLWNLDQADRETFLALIGDGSGSVRGLGDLWARGTRSLWAGRRS